MARPAGLEPRAEVAAELIASLDGPADAAVENLWAAVIERRVAAIEAGIAPIESREDVRRRLDRDVLGR